jgi:hypothetical protein
MNADAAPTCRAGARSAVAYGNSGSTSVASSVRASSGPRTPCRTYRRSRSTRSTRGTLTVPSAVFCFECHSRADVAQRKTRDDTRLNANLWNGIPPSARLNPEAHNTVKDALTRKARGPVVLRNLPPPVPPGREIQRWGDVTSPGAVSSVALWSRSLTRGRFPASGLAGVGEWTAICPTRKAGGPRSCHTASRLPLVPEGFWRIPQRGVLIMGVLPRVIHDAGHACGVTCDTRRRARFFGRGSGFAPRSRRSHSWGVNGFP